MTNTVIHLFGIALFSLSFCAVIPVLATVCDLESDFHQRAAASGSPVCGVSNSLLFLSTLLTYTPSLKRKANVGLFTAFTLRWTCIFHMWIIAWLWLLLAVTKRGEKKKKIIPNISFVTPRFRTDIPFYFPLHTWAFWSIWNLCATV